MSTAPKKHVLDASITMTPLISLIKGAYNLLHLPGHGVNEANFQKLDYNKVNKALATLVKEFDKETSANAAAIVLKEFDEKLGLKMLEECVRLGACSAEYPNKGYKILANDLFKIVEVVVDTFLVPNKEFLLNFPLNQVPLITLDFRGHYQISEPTKHHLPFFPMFSRDMNPLETTWANLFSQFAEVSFAEEGAPALKVAVTNPVVGFIFAVLYSRVLYVVKGIQKHEEEKRQLVDKVATLEKQVKELSARLSRIESGHR